MTPLSHDGFSARRKAIDQLTDVSPYDVEKITLTAHAPDEATPRSHGNRNLNIRKQSVKIIDTNDALKVEVPAPRMNEEAFRIRPDGNDLVIAYEHLDTNNDAHTGKKYGSREYTYHSFRRILPLPENVDTSKIGTHYAKGILNIVLPKKEKENQGQNQLVTD